MEIKGEEKYLVELDMALKRARILIRTISAEYGNPEFDKHLDTIEYIRGHAQDRIIEIQRQEN